MDNGVFNITFGNGRIFNGPVTITRRTPNITIHNGNNGASQSSLVIIDGASIRNYTSGNHFNITREQTVDITSRRYGLSSFNHLVLSTINGDITITEEPELNNSIKITCAQQPIYTENNTLKLKAEFSNSINLSVPRSFTNDIKASTCSGNIVSYHRFKSSGEFYNMSGNINIKVDTRYVQLHLKNISGRINNNNTTYHQNTTRNNNMILSNMSGNINIS